MAVVIETTLGDITVDLYLEQRPVTCLNFLKLCKQKYYNFNLFHTIRNGFIAQTGDPSGVGSGGESIFGILEGPEKRFFSGEKMPKIRHMNAGLISMVCTEDMMVGSQFFFTLAPDLDSLDGVHCVIGEVTEGHDVLRKLNEVICDETHRPYQDVRITHTVVLEDPYNDPPGFRAPSRSPSPSAERLKGGRIAPDEELDETQGKTAEEIQEIIEEKEAKARATILEIVGDLPDADIAPPENVLFVCKLNPVTTDEDLEIIFSRFGKIVSCEVIRDKKTGDSLQYAFIEFSDKKSCEEAYFKMDNVLIDDRRIHVDFSQSVSKMRWLGKGRGVQHFDDADSKDNHLRNKTKQSYNQESERDRYSNRHKHERGLSHDNQHKNEKYSNREENHDKKKRLENDRMKNKARSRSRSLDRSRKNNNRERSRDRSSQRNNDVAKQSDRSHRNSDNARQSDRSHERQSKAHKHDHERQKDNSNSNRNRSPSRDIDTKKTKIHESQDRNTKKNTKLSDKEHNKEKESKRKEEKEDRNSNNVKKHKRSNSIDELQNENAKRIIDHSDKDKNNKRLRKDIEKQTDARTPSPAVKNVSKEEKNKKSLNKSIKKKIGNNKKKKRKPSTSSSDTDTSESSSSSSESSSSSGSDRKKRKRKKKRKYSTSSSDSSDSSSSSSSSDSSSESSSSSSDSEKDRKKIKKNKKKVVQKSRKK